MEDTAATIERLTRERDAARRHLANLTRAIRDPFGVASEITSEAQTRYLTATGWTPTVAPFWTKPGHQPVTLHADNPAWTLRQIPGPLVTLIADALEYLNAPR